jgi:heptosyltransferase III
MKKRGGIKKSIRDLRRWLARKTLSLMFRPIRQTPQYSGIPASIIIFCQEKLGDAILFTPLIANLRRAYPGMAITILAFGEAAARFFSNDPNIAADYNVKEKRLDLLRSLRKQRFDLLFSPKDHLSFSSIFYARMLNARVKVGIDHPLHQGFFSHLLREDFHRPVIEKNCGLLDYLGIEYTKSQCTPYLPPHRVSQTIQGFIDGTDLAGAIGINLSAGERDREWSIGKWLALLQKLNRKTVIFAMPDRFEDKRHIEAALSSSIASPLTSTIFDAAGILSRLCLLISPDTALIHVASCVKTPVVGLYRADKDHYARFSPYLIPHRMVISDSYLIEDIPVDQVACETIDLLSELKK